MIQTWRDKAQERFLEVGEPVPKQESFQYIPFAQLKLPTHAHLPATQSIESSHNLVFIDGYFSSELSSSPPDVVCLPLDQAFHSYGSFLQNRWTKSLREEKDPFALLNGAKHGRGAFIYVPPHVKTELHILHVCTSDALASPRLEISLGKQADVTLVQTVDAKHPHACSNSAIDFSLSEGARLRFFDMQLWPSTARSFASVRATLKRDARLEAMTVTSGAALVRSRFAVELAEENSSLLLRGLAMLTDERQAHFHAVVDHAAPHCTSRQHFKTVLAGQSSASFDGKIFVRPIAQKTMAYQLNNNLLLSDQARANSKPNLEIFADDVKASHGSTVAQLSEEELFYFCSRGLSTQEARFLLAHGFCQELLDAIDIESLHAPLNDLMKRVLQHAL